ncbi:MAG: hypothetical protein E6K80_00625 [Candidatus Eisenbacteria bacterium]|uniref:Uncharacterized protein n=1 Tax=Eiseniibacteriota bacterium TaxID=2212470 RepID=A0A538UBP1_UNCEI|nr:MAG: hypothetical protein E6K80_00625 [Candidatus Eisenbacteria bacterium]
MSDVIAAVGTGFTGASGLPPAMLGPCTVVAPLVASVEPVWVRDEGDSFVIDGIIATTRLGLAGGGATRAIAAGFGATRTAARLDGVRPWATAPCVAELVGDERPRVAGAGATRAMPIGAGALVFTAADAPDAAMPSRVGEAGIFAAVEGLVGALATEPFAGATRGTAAFVAGVAFVAVAVTAGLVAGVLFVAGVPALRFAVVGALFVDAA